MERSPPTIAEIRRAVADYMGSEGCSCCESPSHIEHEAALAKLLRVRKYEDGSGFNFARHQTKKAAKAA